MENCWAVAIHHKKRENGFTSFFKREQKKERVERKAVEQNFKMVGTTVAPKKKIRGGIKEVQRNDFNLEMLFAESVVY